MFKKVLVPLDGSDLSNQAVEHAAALAKATGAAVVLLQVVDSEAQMISQASGATIEPLPMGQVTVEAARSAIAAQREAAEETLESAKKVFTAANVGNVSVAIREGHPGEQIVDAVEELGCDVVVIATSGRSGWKRALLGSVADHVARNTPTASVLLIRPKQD
jgi:nucleotide-binding universal stress UspA family protein